MRSSTWSRFIALAAVVVLVAGCATPASREGMRVTAAPVTKKFPFTVSVKVMGEDAMVDAADMKGAIEASIESSKLFRSVIVSGTGEYELAVFMTKVDRPTFGGSFTVEMEAGWSLTRVADKSVVMRKIVTSTYTATIGDAFVGATRIRLAVEGAVRNNITNGLQAVAALDL